MAVFSVNSFDDVLSPPAGTVTLRSAIQAANTSPGADTIVLPIAGTYPITTVGTFGETDNLAGELAIADAGNLTIQNTSGGVVTIRGNGLNRDFDVDPAGSVVPFTVTFAGLTISGGFALSGGGGGGVDAHAAANVVLSGSVVSGNAATGSGGGVATEAGSTGTLTLLASQVSNNQAQSGGGGVAGLGSGAVTIGAGSILSGDVATGINGGGGVLVKGPALAVLGAVIRNNRALFIATTSTAPGGGIAEGGSGPVTVAGSLIEGNSATGNGGGYDDAGPSSLTVRDSFFLGNSSALNGGGIAAGGPQIGLTGTVLGGNAALSPNITNGGGGGLYVTGAGTTRVTDCTILGNTAVQFGGGIEDDHADILIVTGTTFSGNVVFQNDGGGLFSNTTGDVSISNSLFRGNVAGFLGGGVLAEGGVVNIAASRFTGNAAESGGGADLAGAFLVAGSTFDANRTFGGGGALEISVPANASSGVTNSTIVANSAGGGGIETSVSPPGFLELIDDTVAGNQGGGVKQAAGTLTVQGTILAGNVNGGTPADYTYVGGTLTDQGNNLLSSATGTSSKFGPGTIVADPKLGPLTDNGGPRAGAPSTSAVVPTEALLPGSPAFTTGAAGAGLPTTDERGFARPAKPAIGAYQPQYAGNASANTVFAEVLYETLLDRVADPAGLSGSVGFLNGGGSPTALAQILEATPEYLDAVASLLYLCAVTSDRPTSPPETAGVAAALKGGVTPEQVGEALISSSEFANNYGGANTDTFVEAAFVAVLGRTTSGRTRRRLAWQAALANGVSRSAAAAALLTTTEYLADVTTDDFEAALGRDPSTTDLTAFLGAAKAGVTLLNRRAIVLGSSFGPRT